MTVTAPSTNRGPRATHRSTPPWVWWAVFVVIIVVAATALAFLRPRSADGYERLHPESVAPNGMGAIAAVLRTDADTPVTLESTIQAAEEAAAAGATLVIGDTSPLDDAALTDLVHSAERTVLLDPSARDLDILFAGSSPSGFADATLDAQCDDPVATNADSITVGTTFDIADPSRVSGCFVTGDGYGMLSIGDGSTTTIALDATEVLSNAALDTAGNAALGVGLLAGAPVAWYLPQWDASDDPAARLGQLTPRWVTPVLVMLALAGVAAAIWRGRRFGALVVESLPVTARATETLEGRARLYANASDSEHEADLLRRGAAIRLAQRYGLAASADAAEISAVVAARTGLRAADVHERLARSARTPSELAALAADLTDLERALSHFSDRKDRS